MFCSYYQATVNVATTWFVTGIFRAEECVAFERTMDGDSSCLEFFVPESYEEQFLLMMHDLTELGHIHSYIKHPNRFLSKHHE